jgi:hypothetical protein
MKLCPTAAVEILRPPEEVFELAVSCAGLPRFLLPLAPIPGVARAEMLGGDVLEIGARRRVTMTDGSIVDEELTGFEHPRRHAYRWLRPPAPPFSLFVKSGAASWTFSRIPKGTRVSWVYELELTTPLVYPVAALLALLFQRWMKHGLAQLRIALGA